MPPRKRILCVEDHPETSELITVLLQDVKVVWVQTKADVLRKAAAGHFDLYLPLSARLSVAGWARRRSLSLHSHL